MKLCEQLQSLICPYEELMQLNLLQGISSSNRRMIDNIKLINGCIATYIQRKENRRRYIAMNAEFNDYIKHHPLKVMSKKAVKAFRDEFLAKRGCKDSKYRLYRADGLYHSFCLTFDAFKYLGAMFSIMNSRFTKSQYAMMFFNKLLVQAQWQHWESVHCYSRPTRHLLVNTCNCLVVESPVDGKTSLDKVVAYAKKLYSLYKTLDCTQKMRLQSAIDKIIDGMYSPEAQQHI